MSTEAESVPQWAEERRVRGRRGLQRALAVEEEAEGGEAGEEEREVQVEELEKTCVNSKAYLLTTDTVHDISLYDHLSKLLGEVLCGSPPCANLELWEERSKQLKRDRLSRSYGPIHVSSRHPGRDSLAQAQWRLWKTQGTAVAVEDENYAALPNLLQQAHLWQVAGAGLPKEEMVRVALALKDLVRSFPLASLRFWGKVLGTRANYLIAEAEFQEEEYETETSDNEDNEENDPVKKDDVIFDDVSSEITPDYKPPPKIPCEPAGTGLNTKVYFVCSEPGLPWVQLPHVTPAQIVTARKIRKLFTGDLDAKLNVFPPFPGTERNYLRAQIARISSATHISPIGYFRFDEDEEEEEAATGARDKCVVDADYEGVPLRELADPSVMNWVHHTPYILPQGRITWYNTGGPRGDEEDDDEEDEERKEPDEPEPEEGPPLLTPVSEDTREGGPVAWIARMTSRLVPEYALALLQSTIWPGAHALAADRGRLFECIYVGWGLRALPDNFEPAQPPSPWREFPPGPEVTEEEDPTPEQEAAVRAARREKEELAAAQEEELDIRDDDEEEGEDLDDD